MVEKKEEIVQKQDLTAGQVTDLIGVDRNTLHRWRVAGYGKPRKQQVGKKEFYFYSSDDVELIRGMWTLVQQGYAPRKAYERIKQIQTDHPIPPKSPDKQLEEAIIQLSQIMKRIFAIVDTTGTAFTWAQKQTLKMVFEELVKSGAPFD